MENKPLKIVLGSQSPRRAQLLREAGFEFTIRIKDTDESYPESLPAEEVAEYIARRKSDALSPELVPGELLITADSIVVLNHVIYGKPKDEQNACAIIEKLAGSTHQVYTGVCLTDGMHTHCFTEKTDVTFNPMTGAEIKDYVTRHQPMDKAGAYGIQDWIGVCMVSSITGSYTNVMGLPTQQLYTVIKNWPAQ